MIRAGLKAEVKAARHPEGLLPIETLDRPAILLATCNVILSCITVAEGSNWIFPLHLHGAADILRHPEPTKARIIRPYGA